MTDSTTAVFVTRRIKDALDAEVARYQVKQEGLVHAILTLALTDPPFLAKAAGFERHLGDLGATRLADMGIWIAAVPSHAIQRLIRAVTPREVPLVAGRFPA